MNLGRAKTRWVEAALLLGLAALAGPGGAQNQTEKALKPEVRHLLAAPQEAPKRIRIVSFNVHYAPDPQGLAESLRSVPALKSADVFLLQEIESHESEVTSRTARLAEALKLNYVYAPARLTEEKGGTHGLAILSRFPIQDVKIIPLKQYDLGFNTRRRIALAATLVAGGRPLRIYNVHLDTRINSRERIEQLRPVVEAALQQPVKEVIVGGDFNTNPFRWLFHRFPIFRSNQAGKLDAFMREHGFRTPFAAEGSTLNRTLVNFRVDALYTRGLEIGDLGVERAVEASDHLPLWMEVAWPPKREEEGAR